MTEQVQPHLRPIAFAATGLTLDLLYLLQKQYNMDLESILIVLCVVEASFEQTARALVPKVVEVEVLDL